MSSHHGRGAFDKTRSEYERKLERQRQLENFKNVASADVDEEAAAGGAAGEEEATIVSYFPTADGVKNNAPEENGSVEAPTGAIESARRFLWDEDEDDEYPTPNPNQQKNVNAMGDSASSRANMFFAKTGIEQDSRRLKDIRGFESPGVSDRPSAHLHDVNLNTSFRRSFVPRRANQDESILAPIGSCFMACLDPILHPCSCTPKQKKVSFLTLLVLVALTVAAVVVVTVDFGGSSGQGGNSELESPQAPPENFEPEPPARDVQIRNFIVESGVTSSGDLNNKNSAQHKALTWLLDSDEAQIDVGSSELLQRYALATFFYSTNNVASTSITTPPSDWKASINWMTKHSICKWHGIQCVKNQSETRNTAQETDGVHVMHMNLPRNEIKGKIPSELVALENLQVLHLAENSLSGTIPKTIGLMKHIVGLELQGNELTGTIPKELGECISVRNFHLNDNNLKGSVPPELGDLATIRSFDLSQNNLEGDLPDFTQYVHLKKLKLDGNSFKGVIPAEAGTLSQLEEVNIEDNKLHGTIPPELGKCAKLATFNIGRNEIGGVLPETISGWKSMIDLRLSYNQISGTLPIQITELANLEFLHLEGNKFTGTIPEEISNLSKLRVFRFSDNQFTGAVPEAVCSLKTKEKPEFLADDCGKNGGMEACSCCQECSA